MPKSLLKNTIFLFTFTGIYFVSHAQQAGDVVHGTTVSGIRGTGKSLGQAKHDEHAFHVPDNVVIPLKPEPKAPEPTMQNPDAKTDSKYGTVPTGTTPTTTTPTSAQATFSNFLAIWGSYATVSGRESPYTPPDNCGDVGATQVIATANCRMKVFTKPSVTGIPATTPTGSDVTTLTPVINVDLNSFFSSTQYGVTDISDPHVRYDRFTDRWFIVAIDVTASHKTNNYCCIAVSPTGTLDANSVFQIYYFNMSGIGGSSTDFFDYPTLGIDKNSLYIGGNMFKSGRSFSGCNMWVVDKAKLFASAPSLTITSFPHGQVRTDIYTPQGVQNDDPNATTGYFIGASQTAYSKLVLKRVIYGGAAPVLSADLPIATATTYTPKTVPTLGGTSIDGGDRRLYAAMIKKNKIDKSADLWVAQGTQLNSSGNGGSSGDRDGAYWMQIDVTSATPAIKQSAMLYDGVNASSSAVNYIYPSLVLNGQGHNLMGFTSAGPAKYAQAALASRFRTDQAYTFRSAVDFTNDNSTYNPGANRWGDYTQTVVDPVDDMTMWTFSEYVPTTNAWGVRAAQFKAPPPAAPSIDPSTPLGCSSHIIINGTSSNNSEFFDSGTDDPASILKYAHVNVSISGPNPTAVKNVTFINPTQITADIAFSNSTTGNSYTLTVTNPDGQTASTTVVSPTCPAITFANAIVPTIASVDVIETGRFKASVYPNPASSTAMVEIISPKQQKASLVLFDMLGRRIKNDFINLNNGVNRKEMSLSGLPQGTYIIEIKDGNQILQKVRVVKN